MVFQLAVFGVALPLVVALVAVLLGTRPWRADGPPGRVSGALAVAGAYVASFLGTRGWPDLPAAEATDWTLWVALVACVLAVPGALTRRPALVWPLRAVLVFGALWLMLQPMLEHTWGGAEGALHVAGLGLGILAVWGATEALAVRRSGASVPLVLATAAGGGAAVVAVAASVVTAQLGVALAVAAGVPAVVAWWRGHVSAVGALAVFAPLLGLLWVVAWVYAAVDGLAMLLIAAAPLLAWVGEIPAIRDRPRWLAAAVQVALVALPLAAAMAVSELPGGAPSEYDGGTESAPADGGDEPEVDEDGSYVPY